MPLVGVKDRNRKTDWSQRNAHEYPEYESGSNGQVDSVIFTVVCELYPTVWTPYWSVMIITKFQGTSEHFKMHSWPLFKRKGCKFEEKVIVSVK